MYSPCIRVDSFLSVREYTAPIHSTSPHPNTSLLRVCWTPARILRLSHLKYRRSIPGTQLLQAVRGATSACTSCKMGAVLPRRTAVHFFPHTRPPDTHSHLSQQHTTPSLESGAAFEYQGSLVNTYFSLVLSSMPGKQQRGRHTQHRPRPGPAVVRPRVVDNTLDEASDIASVDGARDMSTSFARGGSVGFDSHKGSGDFDSRRQDRDPSPFAAARGAARGGFGSDRRNGTSSPSPAASGTDKRCQHRG